MNSPEYFLIRYTDNNITIKGRDIATTPNTTNQKLESIKRAELTESQKEIIKANFKSTCRDLINDTWYILTKDSKTDECIAKRVDNCIAKEDETYVLYYNDSKFSAVYLEEGTIYVTRDKKTYRFTVEVPIIILNVDTDVEYLVIPTELAKTAFSHDYQEVLTRCLIKPVRFNLSNFRSCLANEEVA